MNTERPFDVVNTADAQAKVSDVIIVGNPDVWCLICKASSKSQGWMKSTKAIDTTSGVVVQVSTHLRPTEMGKRGESCDMPIRLSQNSLFSGHFLAALQHEESIRSSQNNEVGLLYLHGVLE